jgi:hypothetical protein
VGAPQYRGCGVAGAGLQPGSDSHAHAHAEPHAHPAAHDPVTHAVPGQPVTVSNLVRAGHLAVGGIAEPERAGIPRAAGGVGPAVGPGR